MKKFLVVIPTINSQDTIIEVVSNLKKVNKNIDVLVVDYGSTDYTKKLLKNNNINHFIMPLESTYYKAMQLALFFANKKGYGAIVEFDDKGRYSENDVRRLIDVYQKKKTDFVFSSRFLDKKTYKPSFLKTLGTRFLRKIIFLVSRVRVTDPTMRLKLYSQKSVKCILKYNEHDATPDLIAQLLRNKFSFQEISVRLPFNVHKQLKVDGIQKRFDIFVWTFSILFVNPFRLKLKQGEKNE